MNNGNIGCLPIERLGERFPRLAGDERATETSFFLSPKGYGRRVKRRQSHQQQSPNGLTKTNVFWKPEA
ncbi:hypothetical protein A3D77_04050 [Candidatus Gottesmanbacteria bacterium RIFCSPHIGHO2_02_FULL_39_11]|uniref:Uncharacterized protein n=1 Tax=Candidatus Gottesmanbacteria bacterium RIFCSPHIGHO2_02_FULL_39_11 TaxID=1798382 RepID=A0A1F5ZJU6_9BACT|nr:MAG: hypothetical protein A3D77_04050 [Candidatus Gottesmanbacteria bacterium RIFCSPHIGHO2_02_FULL_39_11]